MSLYGERLPWPITESWNTPKKSSLIEKAFNRNKWHCSYCASLPPSALPRAILFYSCFFFNPNKYLIRMIGFEPEKRGSRWELPQSFPHLFTTSSRKQLWSFVTSTESRIETALRFVFPLRLAGLYLSQVHPGEEQTLSTAISLWSLLERRKPWILTWMEQALHPTCVINTTEALQLEHATSLTAWATKGTEASAPGSCTSLLNPGKNWSIHLTSG